MNGKIYLSKELFARGEQVLYECGALSATAEHMGYIYCKSKGYERYLPQGESITYHIKTGILTPEEASAVKSKIENLK